MYKEAYDASYQYGVRMALESTGVIKTAGAAEAAASEGPGLLAKLLQMAKGAPGQIGSAASGAYGATPSWAKGMAAGGAGGAGLGAVAGDDLSDILMGGAGGAALGGTLGGGGAALSKKLLPGGIGGAESGPVALRLRQLLGGMGAKRMAGQPEMGGIVRGEQKAQKAMSGGTPFTQLSPELRAGHQAYETGLQEPTRKILEKILGGAGGAAGAAGLAGGAFD